MLKAAKRPILEQLVSRTRVARGQRAIFAGKAAAVMLAALGAVAPGGCERVGTQGIQSDLPPGSPAATTPAPAETPAATPEPPPPTRGISADLPPASQGHRPDRPRPRD